MKGLLITLGLTTGIFLGCLGMLGLSLLYPLAAASVIVFGLIFVLVSCALS